MPQHRGLAAANDTCLHYEVSGAGDPLVLIRGHALDTRMWDDQFAAFGRQYRVIRYDMRGYGRSALPNMEDPDRFNAAVLDFLAGTENLKIGLTA